MAVHRLASAKDVVEIIGLYHEAYQGQYPDPTMRDFGAFLEFINDPNNYWFVTVETFDLHASINQRGVTVLSEQNNRIVGSVIYRYQEENRLAKVYGAVMDVRFRGGGLIRELMNYGHDYLKAHTPGVEVIYATTRTVHDKAQMLTEKLGYKKLGVFPNVHKTDDYETHCLTAHHSTEAISKRFANFKIHYKLRELCDLAMDEMSLPRLPAIEPEESSKQLLPCPRLEIISGKTASAFIKHHYEKAKREGLLEFEFYPFQDVNMMLTSADEKVQLFLNFSEVDGHVDFLGGTVFEDLSYTDMFAQMSRTLRNYGARYIELIVRAHQPKIIDSILRARFVPSAYLPAFQLVGGEKGERFDFVAMSRSFEILDFQNLQLTGTNQEYLKIYYKGWKHNMLSPNLLDV